VNREAIETTTETSRMTPDSSVFNRAATELRSPKIGLTPAWSNMLSGNIATYSETTRKPVTARRLPVTSNHRRSPSPPISLPIGRCNSPPAVNSHYLSSGVETARLRQVSG